MRVAVGGPVSRGAGRVPGVLNLFIDFALNQAINGVVLNATNPEVVK